MRFLRRASLVNASAFLFLAIATQAVAQFRPKVTVQVIPGIPSGPASIHISDRIAIQLLTPSGPLDPAQRARIVAARLQAMVDSGADRQALKFKVIGAGRADITWNQSPIIVVNKREANAHSQSPTELAAAWVANIRWLLATPPLTVTPANLVVPFGETRQVTIGGVSPAPFTVFDQRPEVCSTTVGPDGRTLIVKGLTPGSAAVAVTRGDMTISINVAVRKYAGRLKIPRTVMVTGSPAPSEMCLRSARCRVVASADLEPGARVTALAPTTKLPDLPQGYQGDLTFPVRIEGEGYIPVAGSATVRIVNVALPKAEVGKLFYSNSPEQVKKFGSLFAGRLEPGESTRLLYHHQNMIGKPFVFNIMLINTGSTAARVQVVKAAPDPLIDTVAVGYRAGVQFLPNYINDVGEIIELPPMSRVAICSRVVDRMYTASGIMQFRALEGPPLFLRISADLVEDGIVTEGCALPASPMDGVVVLSPWVFPSPTKSIDAEYIVGKAWAFIRVGKHGISDVSKEQQLYGNYGVVYDIKLAIANPNPEQRSVDVLFESAAGLASGVFLIDGKYVKVTHIAPPREVPLARYILGPNESRTVLIKTVPLAGSAYPATILVRS
ncbi:MAG: hypothetical protein Q7T82_20875 [Armatimonadota bacterium]|nr:hypothetical protein [Armatimonadota bacterium]